MKLQHKHLHAIETQNYCEKETLHIFDKIETHLKEPFPSIWHFEQTKQTILKQAQELDKLSLDSKKTKPLFGLSFGAKDLFCIQNTKTTAGSKILEHFISPYTATVVSQLQSPGALFAGKTSMDEFAMGSFTNTSYLGKTSIPGFSDYSAGGSSGGSSASIFANLFDFSIGSDTGGSIRQPAAFTGLVGYKPSYGAFSRYGMISYSSSLDQAGFITKTVEDLKYIIDSIDTSKDIHDSTHIGFEKKLPTKKIQELKIGIFPELLTSESISQSIKDAYQQKINDLSKLGIKTQAIDVPLMKHGAEIYYIIACAEASSNLSRYQGVFFGEKLVDYVEKENLHHKDYWATVASYRSHFFGKEVQKRIMLGSYVLASENFDAIYTKAIDLRKSLTEQINSVLSTVDYLCLPTFPTTSPKWDDISKMTTSQIYLADFMTVCFSLGGFPVITMPTTTVFDIEKTTGMQMVGKKLCDYELISDCFLIETLLKGEKI